MKTEPRNGWTLTWTAATSLALLLTGCAKNDDTGAEPYTFSDTSVDRLISSCVMYSWRPLIELVSSVSQWRSSPSKANAAPGATGACVACVPHADVVRVHDVRTAVQALRVADAILR